MIIGLTGLARSGKDTFATILRMDFGFAQHAFAYPLKKAIPPLFGVDHDYVMNEANKSKPMPGWPEWTLRQVMQRLGTEAMRGVFGEDFWIRRLTNDLTHWQDHVISDVRFDNEAQAIHDRGGVIVCIVRGDAGLQGTEGAHASEAGVSPHLIHAVVRNDGTLGELRAEAHKLIALLHKLQTA